MRAYQEKYIQNLNEVYQLNAPPKEFPESAAAYMAQRAQRVRRVRELSEENTALLRQELFPLLDNIASADGEDIANLEDFAAHLVSGAAQLDMVLSYYLHNALLVYARRWEKRDMLIRELYQTAMALFYMQELASRAQKYPYRSKMALLFGEAASYIKVYDQIEDQETRGYIHRSMANLALVYGGLNEEDGRRKMQAIRRSLRILQDPVYHQKSPDLPWDLYIYKSHQERTTAIGLSRAGVECDPQELGEIMESAEYVIKAQNESSLARGDRTALRWKYAYEAAQFHCGIRPLSYLLGWMESAYMERDESDYSQEGVYRNMFLPAIYGSYIRLDPSYKPKKKEVLGLMYRRMAAYVRKMPHDIQMSEATVQQLLACLQTFVEYPDGIQQKDFLMDLVVCRNVDAYVSSRMAAEVAVMLVDRALDRRPDFLSGSFGYGAGSELLAHREDLRSFAFEGCLAHNVGVLTFSNMARRIGRSWLEEEKELYEYHVFTGADILSQSDSTRPFAPAALGHHRFYNGQGGYPDGYLREEDPAPAMTDLISGAVHFIRLIDDRVFITARSLSLEEALEQVRRDAGVRLAPEVAELLVELEGELRGYLEDGQLRAYEAAFAMLRGDREVQP